MNEATHAAPSGHRFDPTIIREYDIRGVFPDTLDRGDAFAIGQTFASLIADETGRQPIIAVGRDGRLSSPPLAHELIAGLKAAGAHVLDIGVGPTPMLYFGVYHLEADAGIMVTGSHNPPTHNGFKLMKGRASFYGEQIRALAERAARGEWHCAQGSAEEKNIKVAYIDAMLAACDIVPPEGVFKVVWDAGNGAAGEITNMLAKQLAKQRCVSLTLFTEINGHFPNHHPDPSVAANLAELQRIVISDEAVLGLAFDGDGDRLGAIDDKGRLISCDHLLMLLAQHVLAANEGATIIADVKSSQSVFESVERAGGTPLMWKTGHSHIKTKMKEVGAAFAGEASGHLFFADRYYGFDDGLYAALRLLELVSKLDRPLSEVIDALPRMHSTPEMRIDVDEARKFLVIDEIRARLDAQGINYLAIDGVRVMTPAGWWLIRASNTQAAIIARAEAYQASALADLSAMLEEQLQLSGVGLF